MKAPFGTYRIIGRLIETTILNTIISRSFYSSIMVLIGFSDTLSKAQSIGIVGFLSHTERHGLVL